VLFRIGSPVGGPHSTGEIEGAAVVLQRKRRAKKRRKFYFTRSEIGTK